MKLFKYNFANKTIAQISNIKGTNVTDAIDHYGILYKDEFYFVATASGSNFLKLHKINASGEIKQVSNINPSGSDFSTVEFHILNDVLYFSGLSGSNLKVFSLKKIEH